MASNTSYSPSQGGEGPPEPPLVDVYTQQVDAVWELLRNRGVVFGDAAEAIPSQDGFDSFAAGYEWMIAAMARRIPAASLNYPLWAWLSPPTYPATEPSVVIHARIPPDRLLVSDFAAWDQSVLYGFPVSPDGRPLDAADPDVPHCDIERSWEAIFIDTLPPPHGVNAQVVLDGLYLHEVVGVQRLPVVDATSPDAHQATVPPIGDAAAEMEDVEASRAAAGAAASTLCELRRSYEQRVCNALTAHSMVRDACVAIRDAAYLYMKERAEIGPPLDELLALTATPLDLPFSGRVGADPARLRAVWEGDTRVVPDADTVRTLLTHFHCFITRILAPDLVSLEHAALNDIATRCGWDLELLAKLHSADYPSGEELARMTRHRLTRAQNAMRAATGVSERDAWSHASRAAFAAVGGSLTAWEEQLESPHGPLAVPWIDAARLCTLIAANKTVRVLANLGIPLVTGVSGCTLRYMTFGGLIAPRVAPALIRAASLAFLVPTGAHTFYEVAAAATAAAGGRAALRYPRSHA
ncbi:uncharacterized protein AMSG_09141 [Thecamonas trahens ATCC 50062]|uniref:Uncharacterized protein n=1 Tax=Thecamonas trahens ATCC 50062 TaxID=461836 RepID=A0A0L0DL34_THETB|nr:hypothetical protein AMSG_09141 [Thecamonas trahens ATCC 50062]KNC52970.1 hypothetical protein AMSG_09141 [Thecamonas trahens ATCC 50062]|eukprot:XP_013754862.1 hypothetical protein AMSG_09141 [Thecamonas trahens ATCC 50062]